MVNVGHQSKGQRLFDLCDVKRDGILDLRDADMFTAHLCQAFTISPPPALSQAVRDFVENEWEVLVGSQNERAEWIALFERIRTQPASWQALVSSFYDLLQMFWRTLDPGTPAEILTAFRYRKLYRGGGHLEADGEAAFHLLDANGDGIVTRSEWMEWANAYFDRTADEIEGES